MDLNQQSVIMNWGEYMEWQDTFLMKYTTELSKNPELVNQILQTYIEKTREQVQNVFRSPPHANILFKKLAVIIDFFHQSRGNDKKIDMGEFLDSMSEAIAMYCDLRISALMMYKERIEDVQHAISSVLKMYLGNNHIHIVNALLRVKRHKFSKNLFEKFFTYIEEKAPFKECKSSPITYCRYLLFYRQWKKMYSDVAILKQLSTRGQANLKPPPNFRNHPLFYVLRPEGISVPPNMTLFFLTAPMNTNTVVEKFFQYLKSQNVLDQDRCDRQVTPMEEVIEVIDLTDDPREIKRENNEGNQSQNSINNSVNEVTLAFKRMTPVSSQLNSVPKINICNEQQQRQQQPPPPSQSPFVKFVNNSSTESINSSSGIFKSSQCSTSSMQFLEELSQTSKLPPWSSSVERSSHDPRSSNNRINETESTDTGIFSDRSISDGCGNSPGYELESKDFCTINDLSTIVIDDENDRNSQQTTITAASLNKKSISENNTSTAKAASVATDDQLQATSQSKLQQNVDISNKSINSDECTIIETSNVVSIVIAEDTEDTEMLKTPVGTTSSTSRKDQEQETNLNSENITKACDKETGENSEVTNSVPNVKSTTSSSDDDSAVISIENSSKTYDTVVSVEASTTLNNVEKTVVETVNKNSADAERSKSPPPLLVENSSIVENTIEKPIERIENDSISKNVSIEKSVNCINTSTDINTSSEPIQSPKRNLRDVSVSTANTFQKSPSQQISVSEEINNENDTIERKRNKVSVQSIAIGTDDDEFLPLFTDFNKETSKRTKSSELKNLREIHSPQNTVDEEEDEVNQMYVGPLKIRTNVNREFEILTSPQKEPDFHGFSNNRSSKHGSNHTTNSNVNCSVHLQNITEKTKELLKSKSSQARKATAFNTTTNNIKQNSSSVYDDRSKEAPHIKISVPKTILKNSSNSSKDRKSSKHKKTVVVTNEHHTHYLHDDDDDDDIEQAFALDELLENKFAVNSTLLSQSRKGGSAIIAENHYDKPEESSEDGSEEYEEFEDYVEDTEVTRTQQRSRSRDRDPYSRYSHYNDETFRYRIIPSPRRSRLSSFTSEQNGGYETRSRSRSQSVSTTRSESISPPRKTARKDRSDERTLTRYEDLKRKYNILKEIQVILQREDLYKKKLEIDKIRDKKQQEKRILEQQEERRKRYYKRKKELTSNPVLDENPIKKQTRRGRPPRKKIEEMTVSSPPARVSSPSAYNTTTNTYLSSTYYSAPTRIPTLPEIVETLRLSSVNNEIKPAATVPAVPTIQNSIERLQNSLANSKILSTESSLTKSNFDKKFHSIKSGNLMRNIFDNDNIISSDLNINSDSNQSGDDISAKEFNEAIPKNHNDEVSDSQQTEQTNGDIVLKPNSQSANLATAGALSSITENKEKTNLPDSTVDDSSLVESVENQKNQKLKLNKKNKVEDININSSDKPRPIRKCKMFFSKEAIDSHRLQFSNYYRSKARVDFLHITGDTQLPSSSSSTSSSPLSAEVTEIKDTTDKLSWEKFMALPENKQNEELLNKSDVIIDQNLTKNLDADEIQNVNESSTATDFKGAQILKNELVSNKSNNNETNVQQCDNVVHLKKEEKKLQHSSRIRSVKIKRAPSATIVNEHISNSDKIVKKKKYHPLPPPTKKQLKPENNFFPLTETTTTRTTTPPAKKEISKRRLEFIDIFKNIDSENLNKADSSNHMKRKRVNATVKKTVTPTATVTTTSQSQQSQKQSVSSVPKSVYVYEYEDDISLAKIKQQLAKSICEYSKSNPVLNPNAKKQNFYFKDGKLFNNDNEIDICDISIVSWEEVVGEGSLQFFPLTAHKKKSFNHSKKLVNK